MSAISDACRIVGGATKLASLVGVTPQAISKWVAADRAPAERCLVIEDACDGKVTRYQLRPDVFGDAPNQEAA